SPDLEVAEFPTLVDGNPRSDRVTYFDGRATKGLLQTQENPHRSRGKKVIPGSGDQRKHHRSDHTNRRHNHSHNTDRAALPSLHIVTSNRGTLHPIQAIIQVTYLLIVSGRPLVLLL